MSEPANKAVFVSYASQDAEAARRICEALRAAGVEAWFDQSELRGGDAWDAKIRKQIATCDLFIPVISANTDARLEGYFRIEWKLAAQRTHAMADEKTFLLPVVVDETRDAEAKVPAEFRAVQWTRLRQGFHLRQAYGGQDGGQALDDAGATAFATRVRQLLGDGEVSPQRALPASAASQQDPGAPALARKPRRPLNAAGLALLVGVGLALWQPWRQARETGSPQATRPAAPLTEAQKLVAQARALYEPWDFAMREDFNQADQLLERAMALDPLDGAACIHASLVNSGFVVMGFDASPARKQRARTCADRAVKLAPDDYRAQFAQAFSYRFEPTLVDEGVRRLCELADLHPADSLLQRTAGSALRVVGRSAEAFRYYDRATKLPDAASAHYNRAMSLRDLGELAEAEAAVDQAIGTTPPLPKAFALKISLAIDRRGDLAEARGLVARVPPRYLLEDMGAITASQVWLWSREWDKCIAALVPARDYLETNLYTGPKAYRSGLAHWKAGRRDAAVVDWRAALRIVEQRLQEQPSAAHLLSWKATLSAALGDAQTATQILNTVEQQRSGGTGVSVSAINLAQTYVLLGNHERALAVLEPLVRLGQRDGDDVRFGGTGYAYVARNMLRFDPVFDPLRENPRFAALLEAISQVTGGESAAGMRAGVRSENVANEKSVAVLAFRQLSADPENEYLCEAIPDELCNALGKLPGLKVAASGSTFSFKGNKRERLAEMARQLGVAYLVDGSVQKIGNRVRVRAELVRAVDESPVWKSDLPDYEVKDMLAVQDEVVAAIAKSLQLQLGTAKPAVVVINPEAYRLYYEGRRAWSMRGTAEFAEKAETFFRQAIAADAKLGRAYSGLADVLRNAWTAEPNGLAYADRNSDRLRELQSLVETALRWEPESAEAYTARGGISFQTWRFPEAERDLRTAIRLNPNYADAHLVLGRLLSADGRLDEALAELKLASGLDPLSSRIFDNYGGALREAGRYAEALVQVERAVALQPDSQQALRTKMNVLSNLGRHDEAIAMARNLASREVESRSVVVFVRAGQKEEAARNYAMARASRRSTTTPLAALGRYEEALNSLRPDEAVVTAITGLYYYDTIDPLRNDPRFVSYLTTLGIKEAHDRAQAWRAAHPPEKAASK